MFIHVILCKLWFVDRFPHFPDAVQAVFPPNIDWLHYKRKPKEVKNPEKKILDLI